MAKPLPDQNLPWPIAIGAVFLIADREQLRLKAYKDFAGVWTIAWGETEGVRPGDVCTKEEADKWLCEDLTERVKAVQDMLTEHANENQLGALVSLAYNIGLRDDKKKTGLYYSSILKQHNLGNFEAAARAFGLYNKALNPRTGELEVLQGLVVRRAQEAALYLTPTKDEPQLVMPQAVAGESKLTASPIAQGGAITAGTGVLAAANELADKVNGQSGALGSIKGALATVKDFVHGVADFVGVPPGVLLAVVLIGAGVAVVRYRRQQRSEGWA